MSRKKKKRTGRFVALGEERRRIDPVVRKFYGWERKKWPRSIRIQFNKLEAQKSSKNEGSYRYQGAADAGY